MPTDKDPPKSEPRAWKYVAAIVDRSSQQRELKPSSSFTDRPSQPQQEARE